MTTQPPELPSGPRGLASLGIRPGLTAREILRQESPLSVPELHRRIKEQLGPLYDLTAVSPPTYARTARLVWALKYLGLIEETGREPAVTARERDLTRRDRVLIRLAPGMEDRPEWEAPWAAVRKN